ncbi:Pheromone-processing carboxypeptidase KEX1 [Smittium mucronatum]|uniref:Pheromone-processing carboxypeptidase KEX1 n=1 Tax=Smittium mucronatum TaxID=133383 RepID=A0A1R0GZP5_9FUNG|nr:Pheromone-processing carboxypeptidase KEX1 [Smittium mucronatum]
MIPIRKSIIPLFLVLFLQTNTVHAGGFFDFLNFLNFKTDSNQPSTHSIQGPTSTVQRTQKNPPILNTALQTTSYPVYSEIDNTNTLLQQDVVSIHLSSDVKVSGQGISDKIIQETISIPNRVSIDGTKNISDQITILSNQNIEIVPQTDLVNDPTSNIIYSVPINAEPDTHPSYLSDQRTTTVELNQPTQLHGAALEKQALISLTPTDSNSENVADELLVQKPQPPPTHKGLLEDSSIKDTILDMIGYINSVKPLAPHNHHGDTFLHSSEVPLQQDSNDIQSIHGNKDLNEEVDPTLKFKTSEYVSPGPTGNSEYHPSQTLDMNEYNTTYDQEHFSILEQVPNDDSYSPSNTIQDDHVNNKEIAVTNVPENFEDDSYTESQTGLDELPLSDFQENSTEEVTFLTIPDSADNNNQPPGYPEKYFKGNSKPYLTKEDYIVKKLPLIKNSSIDSIQSFAGQIELGDEDSNMFFWLVKNITNTKNQDSLLIWLNGGPGCSSMYGLFLENGPFEFTTGGYIRTREYSWTRQVDMLFIDQPFGTGLSTTPVSKYVSDYVQSNTKLTDFLNKFFAIFPEYSGRKIILAGESDAGNYLINLANTILYGGNSSDTSGSTHSTGGELTSNINLHRVMIGNGWIDPLSTYESYEPFLDSRGVLDGPTRDLMKSKTRDCVNSYKIEGFASVRSGICGGIMNHFFNMKVGSGQCYNVFNVDLLDSRPDCGKNYPPETSFMTEYMSRLDVQVALNIKPGKSTKEWVKCSNEVLNSFEFSTTRASVSLLPKLTEKVPVLLFDGDKDIICNSLSHEIMISRMDWGGAKGFTNVKDRKDYSKWDLNGRSVGIFNTQRNLTHAILFNGSHMASIQEPLASLEMLTIFAGLDYDNVRELFTTDSGFLGYNIANSTVTMKDKNLEKSTTEVIAVDNPDIWKSLAMLLIVVGALGLVFYLLHRHFGNRFSKESFSKVVSETDEDGNISTLPNDPTSTSNSYMLHPVSSSRSDSRKENQQGEVNDSESQTLMVDDGINDQTISDEEFSDSEFDFNEVYLTH